MMSCFQAYPRLCGSKFDRSKRPVQFGCNASAYGESFMLRWRTGRDVQTNILK